MVKDKVRLCFDRALELLAPTQDENDNEERPEVTRLPKEVIRVLKGIGYAILSLTQELRGIADLGIGLEWREADDPGA